MSGDRGRLVVRREPHADVVVLRGEVDLATTDALAQATRAGTPGAPAIVLDLSEVTYFDSAGVRMLDDMVRDAARRGAAVRVVAPAGSIARFTLDLTHVADGALAESADDALASLPAPSRPARDE